MQNQSKLLLATIELAACLVARGQEATLHGRIRDAVTGTLTSCTVSIVDANGKLVVENQAFRAGFRCAGEFTRRLPPGHTRIRVTRGFETQGVQKELDLVAGTDTDLTFILRRNIDLRARGWFGGDSHVHMLHGERTLPVSFDFVALTARAEDLAYLSLAQAWNLANPTPEALEEQLRPRSRADCLLTWNLEAPKNYYQGDAGRCLGHCWNLGLRGRTPAGVDVIRTLLDASAWDYESDKPTYANFESHRLIHEQGGAVFYTHPARWWMGPWGGQGGYPKVDRMRVSNLAVELPLDTILGPTFDGIDLITGPGEFEANEKAFQMWALLLNHGYHLAATGSSDACFDRPGGGIPGVPRTYTFITGRFALDKITRATAAGHTFVTSGPLLVATLDGKPPGSIFRSGKKPHVLAIEGWASGESFTGLARLEILRNGQPYETIALPSQPLCIRTNLTLLESQSGWYCVRLWASGNIPRLAVSSAFYFEHAGDPQPQPASISVQAKVVDAETGAPLSGWVTEVAYAGTLPRELKRHRFRNGQETLKVPGTVRLRAQAAGYTPLVLSPVLENKRLINQVTGLTDTDLLDWQIFERVRQNVSEVELPFRLQRTTRNDRAAASSPPPTQGSTWVGMVQLGGTPKVKPGP